MELMCQVFLGKHCMRAARWLWVVQVARAFDSGALNFDVSQGVVPLRPHTAPRGHVLSTVFASTSLMPRTPVAIARATLIGGSLSRVLRYYYCLKNKQT